MVQVTVWRGLYRVQVVVPSGRSLMTIKIDLELVPPGVLLTVPTTPLPNSVRVPQEHTVPNGVNVMVVETTTLPVVQVNRDLLVLQTTQTTPVVQNTLLTPVLQTTQTIPVVQNTLLTPVLQTTLLTPVLQTTQE